MKNPGQHIITDFTHGNKEAFALVYKTHFGRLYYFVCRYINNHQEAQDITAETFIKLWKLHKNFDTHQNIKAFLYITARNACMDFLRYQQRQENNRQSFHYATMEEADFTFIHDEIKVKVLQYIREEIENLPTQCQRIFKMAFFENLKNAEIAERLQLTLQTVKNQKVRAIKILRLALADKDLALASLLFAFGSV